MHCISICFAFFRARERERGEKRERKREREKKAMNDCAKNGKLEEMKLVVVMSWTHRKQRESERGRVAWLI